MVDSCYESDEFAAENYHDSGKIFTFLKELPSQKNYFKGLLDREVRRFK